MSNNSNTSSSSGVRFPGLLTILFIGLKLGHVITWPWLWILSPLWIPVAVIIFAFLIGIFIGLLGIEVKK